MYYKEFIELNLPIGTKVRYKDSEWLYVGLGINSDKETCIQLARNYEEGSYPYYDYIASWHNEEIEVIEYPVKYMSIAKYHVGDVLYNYDSKCMILEERDKDGYYLAYHYDIYEAHLISEENFTLEKQEFLSDEIKEETKEKGE